MKALLAALASFGASAAHAGGLDCTEHASAIASHFGGRHQGSSPDLLVMNKNVVTCEIKLLKPNKTVCNGRIRLVFKTSEKLGTPRIEGECE